MEKQNTHFDFGNNWEPQDAFTLYEEIIKDRRSVYSVSIGRVSERDDIGVFLQYLKGSKKYQNATHNSWAARISHEGAIYETKNDDGETGAGMVILRLMQRHDVTNAIICVTRWFGGVKLMGDRFKHLQDATKYAIEHMER